MNLDKLFLLPIVAALALGMTNTVLSTLTIFSFAPDFLAPFLILCLLTFAMWLALFKVAMSLFS